MKKLFVLFSLMLACAMYAHAQPTKPLTKIAIQKAIDTTKVGGEISLKFNYKSTEIIGEIMTTAIAEQKNKVRRQASLQIVQNNPKDLKANLEMYTLANDTATANYYKRICYALLEAALQANPTNGELHFEMGKLLQTEFKFQEAFTAYSNAQKYMPDSAKVYLKGGELYFYYQQYNEAEAYFTEALNRDASLLDVHLFYGIVDIFTSMTAVSKGEKNVADITQKLTYIDQAIAKYPARKDLQDYKQYAKMLWYFYNGFMAGISDFKQEDLDKKFKVASLFKLNATDLATLKELEAYFQQIIAQKRIPNTSLAHESIAFIALIQDKEAKTLQYFEKVTKLNPEKSENYQNIVFIYLVRKDFKKAEAILRRKMTYKEDATDYLLLALIYERQKKYDKAKAFCKEGLAKYPSMDLKALLGMLEGLTNNHADAEKYLQEVVDAKPNDEALLYKLALMQLAQEKWAVGYRTLYQAAENKSEAAKELLVTYFKY